MRHGLVRYNGRMRDSVDPTSVADLELRALIRAMMNRIEALEEEVRALKDERQRLRDDNNRLKGEQGQPRILPKTPAKNVSSERERKRPTTWCKRAKNPTLSIDRTEIVAVDRSLLPADAVFKGYQRVTIQDLRLSTETICFRKEKFYSPTTRQTYLAPNPPGYTGQFGPGVKAFIVTLAFESGLSEAKIYDLVHLAGMQISRGQIAAVLAGFGTTFTPERRAILAAGLRSSPWQHLDATPTRVAGINQQCHVLTNPLYTVYTTVPQTNRLHVLDVLRGGEPRQFWLDQTTERLMRLMDVPLHARKAVVKALPRHQLITEAEIDTFLDTTPRLNGKYTQKWIKDSCAIAAYHAQRDPPFPVVQLLIGDDAPQWAMLTEELALCWVHDGRHYTRLEPRMDHHRTLLADFRKAYWLLYHELRQYQQAPRPGEAARLRQAFDDLVGQTTGYTALDARIAITAEKRRGLLMVLEHPEIPLHNNPAELAVRRRVRKRAVSGGLRTVAGAARWDIGQTLVATARQLNVNIYDYIADRLSGRMALSALADQIAERAATMPLGGSWEGRPIRAAWKPVEVSMWHA